MHDPTRPPAAPSSPPAPPPAQASADAPPTIPRLPLELSPNPALAVLPVPVLIGPTASGKTGAAIALAQRLAARGVGVEIVSADSAQVYKGLDIGSAKPSLAERAGVPHHLLDLIEPSEVYSAARFAADAARAIWDIRARGHLPLVVGGTMLYVRALTEGLAATPPANAFVREALSEEAAAQGWPALHARLARLDPVTANRLNPADGQRIQRALEVFEVSGETLSEWHARPPVKPSGERFRVLAMIPGAREDLHRRIDARIDAMMRAGFLDEVRRLHDRGDLNAGLPSVRAVGYRQLWAHLDGQASLADAVEAAKAATRQFAKRQFTWLNGWKPRPPVLDAADPALVGRLEALALAP